MELSKIDFLFIKKFLSNITVTEVEMFSATGKNYLSNGIDKVIRERKIAVILKEGNYIYVPITREGKEDFLLRINNASHEAHLESFAISLKSMLEESLNYVQHANRPANIDMLDDFLVELLIREPFGQTNNLFERANLLHFDYTIPRSIVLVDIIHFKSIVRHSSDKEEVQEKLNGILRLLKNSVANFTEYAAYLYDDKFILFKNQNAELDAELKELREKIQSQLALTTQFVISRTCTNLDDYRREFKKVTELHQNISRRHLQTPLYHVRDYQIELLLLDTDEETRSFFTKNNKEALQEIRANNGELVETLVYFFKNSMDTKKTAEKMFIHKNTVYYRIKKLSQLLDVDLFDSYACTFLYLQTCLDS
jgi:sugar diacid utilization regulator